MGDSYSNQGRPRKRGRNTVAIVLAALIVLGLLLLVLGVRMMSGEDMMNSSRWNSGFRFFLCGLLAIVVGLLGLLIKGMVVAVRSISRRIGGPDR